MALMLITHDLAVAAEVADRLAIMHRGRVVEAGPTGEVLREMRHPYTRALFAASGAPAGAAARGPARTPLLEVEGMVRDYPGAAARPLRRARGRSTPCTGVSFALARRREPRPRRRERLRQVDARPRRPRPRADAGRQRPRSRARRCRAGERMPREPARQDAGGLPGPLRQLQPAPPGRRGWWPSPSTSSTARRAGAARAPGGGRGAARTSGSSRRGRREVHPRVLRRPAPAHRHRPRADHPPEAHHPRRGGLRARRAGPRADPRPPRRPHGAARPRLSLHQPRPRAWCARSPTG